MCQGLQECDLWDPLVSSADSTRLVGRAVQWTDLLYSIPLCCLLPMYKESNGLPHEGNPLPIHRLHVHGWGEVLQTGCCISVYGQPLVFAVFTFNCHVFYSPSSFGQSYICDTAVFMNGLWVIRSYTIHGIVCSIVLTPDSHSTLSVPVSTHHSMCIVATYSTMHILVLQPVVKLGLCMC